MSSYTSYAIVGFGQVGSLYVDEFLKLEQASGGKKKYQLRVLTRTVSPFCIMGNTTPLMLSPPRRTNQNLKPSLPKASMSSASTTPRTSPSPTHSKGQRSSCLGCATTDWISRPTSYAQPKTPTSNYSFPASTVVTHSGIRPSVHSIDFFFIACFRR